MPTLAGLRAFEAAARHRSFKRAAEELCVTESSVSHQVRGLERQLGVRLFERLHRRVILTTEGIQYMLVVSRSFSDIAYTSDHIRRNATSGPSRSRLILACDPGFAQHWLLPRVAGFTHQYGDVDLEIIPTLEPTRELSDRATVGIHYGWRITGSFHCEEIARTRVFPVCRPGLVSQASDLARTPLFHDRTLRMWGEWIEAAGITDIDWRKGPIVHSSAICLEAALRGHGMALANEIIAERYLDSGELVRPFELAIDPPGYRWYLLTESTMRESAEASMFREWLTSELRIP